MSQQMGRLLADLRAFLSMQSDEDRKRQARLSMAAAHMLTGIFAIASGVLWDKVKDDLPPTEVEA